MNYSAIYTLMTTVCHVGCQGGGLVMTLPTKGKSEPIGGYLALVS